MASSVRFFSLLAAGLVSLGVFAGCAPVYHPNTHLTPMLNEAGAMHVGAAATTSGVDAHVAVAVTDRVSVAGAASYGRMGSRGGCPRSTPNCTAELQEFRRHRMAEVALGITEPVTDALYVDLYAGYGRGMAEAVNRYEFFSVNYVQAEGRYGRFYVQPGMFVDTEPVRLHGALRISNVRFTELEVEGDRWSRGFASTFLEPALTMRFGPPPFGIVLQGSLAIPVGPALPYDYQPVTLSAGVSLRLQDLFR